MKEPDFYTTQLGKLLQLVKEAYLSQALVVYIPSPDRDLINSLVYDSRCEGTIIPRMENPEPEPTDGVLCRSYGCRDNYYWNLTMACEQGQMEGVVTETKQFESLVSRSLLVYTLDGFSDESRELTTIRDIVNTICIRKKFNDKWSGAYKTNGEVLRNSLIIINTPNEESLPMWLQPYTQIVRTEPLSDREIEYRIFKTLEENDMPSDSVSESLLRNMVVNMRGFNNQKIARLVKIMLIREYIGYGVICDEKKVLDVIRVDKREMLGNCIGLKWENTDDNDTEASGLDRIAEWLDDYQDIFRDIRQAERMHKDIPKGILVSGIPGSGKSLMAKSAARKLELPLISIDMGALRGSFQGESEHNMIKALSMAEAMSPCVLWVDEIEKAFSGSSGDQGDSGVGCRMFGKFLTWMQEKRAACFVFATANDITMLPSELFRSERFDRKFFSFLPTATECADIFASQIALTNRRYVEKLSLLREEEKRNMPGAVYDKRLEDVKFWLKILNEVNSGALESLNFGEYSRVKKSSGEQQKNIYQEDIEDAYGWSSDDFVGPRVKLFTGSDISAILKEIKHRISKVAPRNIVYTSKMKLYNKSDVEKIAPLVIGQFKSYGETNIKDIVKCYLKLAENQFISASSKCYVHLDEYDEDRMCYRVRRNDDGEIVYDSVVQNSYYDKVLFHRIISAINYYSPKIKKMEGNRL